jgi:RNA processing factor Prp31
LQNEAKNKDLSEIINNAVQFLNKREHNFFFTVESLKLHIAPIHKFCNRVRKLSSYREEIDTLIMV